MPSYLWELSESPARRALLSPLLLAEGFYRLGVRLHRGAYAAGLKRRVRLSVRVVSIGNLAVGGSAKTPTSAWLARELRDRGRKVVLLSRGVGGRRPSAVNVVSDGELMIAGPADVGDEPVWLAGAARGVPVLAGRNRVALGLRALSVFGAEVLILDDGFQHHRLHRDVDLVCVDGRLGLGNGHVLPRGPLREPASALRRADALLLTRPSGARVPGDESFPTGMPRFRVEIAPRRLRALGTGEHQPLDRLRGRRIGLLAAIARPDRLRQDLERLGAEVAALRTFPDHHLYRPKEIGALDPALPWVTTAKDAVKIPPAWAAGVPLLVLEEEVRSSDREALLEWLDRRLDAPRSVR